jgi:hypothetical protein
MYSVLLFLLVIILAPIALTALFRLLINPLFWGLLVMCVLVCGGYYIYAERQNAEWDARHRAAREAYEQQKADEEYVRNQELKAAAGRTETHSAIPLSLSAAPLQQRSPTDEWATNHEAVERDFQRREEFRRVHGRSPTLDELTRISQ